jgi:dynein heavy chain
MKGSPYAKVFEERIKDWENWLEYTLNFSEFWVKVQSVWLYLEPIFSSPDILKHLPVEGSVFREVDKSWKTMMAEISSQPKVLEFTKNRSFLNSLKDCHEQL